VWDKIYLAAPEGTSWPLDLDTAEARLRERFPDAVIGRDHAPVSGKDYVDFDVSVGGDLRRGIYVDGFNLTLYDGTPADWADTIAWFLSLLPEGTRVIAMTEHNFQPTPIPAGTSPEGIRDLLDNMIRAN
jgi:hypothetical protein